MSWKIAKGPTKAKLTYGILTIQIILLVSSSVQGHVIRGKRENNETEMFKGTLQSGSNSTNSSFSIASTASNDPDIVVQNEEPKHGTKLLALENDSESERQPRDKSLSEEDKVVGEDKEITLQRVDILDTEETTIKAIMNGRIETPATSSTLDVMPTQATKFLPIANPDEEEDSQKSLENSLNGGLEIVSTAIPLKKDQALESSNDEMKPTSLENDSLVKKQSAEILENLNKSPTNSPLANQMKHFENINDKETNENKKETLKISPIKSTNTTQSLQADEKNQEILESLSKETKNNANENSPQKSPKEISKETESITSSTKSILKENENSPKTEKITKIPNIPSIDEDKKTEKLNLQIPEMEEKKETLNLSENSTNRPLETLQNQTKVFQNSSKLFENSLGREKLIENENLSPFSSLQNVKNLSKTLETLEKPFLFDSLTNLSNVTDDLSTKESLQKGSKVSTILENFSESLLKLKNPTTQGISDNLDNFDHEHDLTTPTLNEKTNYGRSMGESDIEDLMQPTTKTTTTNSQPITFINLETKNAETQMPKTLQEELEAQLEEIQKLNMPTTLPDLIEISQETTTSIGLTSSLPEVKKIKENSTIPSGEKKGKFINDNSTNAQQLNLPDTSEVWTLAGMKIIPKINDTMANNFDKKNLSMENGMKEKTILDWTQIMMNKDFNEEKRNDHQYSVMKKNKPSNLNGFIGTTKKPTILFNENDNLELDGPWKPSTFNLNNQQHITTTTTPSSSTTTIGNLPSLILNNFSTTSSTDSFQNHSTTLSEMSQDKEILTKDQNASIFFNNQQQKQQEDIQKQQQKYEEDQEQEKEEEQKQNNISFVTTEMPKQHQHHQQQQQQNEEISLKSTEKLENSENNNNHKEFPTTPLSNWFEMKNQFNDDEAKPTNDEQTSFKSAIREQNDLLSSTEQSTTIPLPILKLPAKPTTIPNGNINNNKSTTQQKNKNLIESMKANEPSPQGLPLNSTNAGIGAAFADVDVNFDVMESSTLNLNEDIHEHSNSSSSNNNNTNNNNEKLVNEDKQNQSNNTNNNNNEKKITNNKDDIANTLKSQLENNFNETTTVSLLTASKQNETLNGFGSLSVAHTTSNTIIKENVKKPTTTLETTIEKEIIETTIIPIIETNTEVNSFNKQPVTLENLPIDINKNQINNNNNENNINNLKNNYIVNENLQKQLNSIIEPETKTKIITETEPETKTEIETEIETKKIKENFEFNQVKPNEIEDFINNQKNDINSVKEFNQKDSIFINATTTVGTTLENGNIELSKIETITQPFKEEAEIVVTSLQPPVLKEQLTPTTTKEDLENQSEKSQKANKEQLEILSPSTSTPIATTSHPLHDSNVIETLKKDQQQHKEEDSEKSENKEKIQPDEEQKSVSIQKTKETKDPQQGQDQNQQKTSEKSSDKVQEGNSEHTTTVFEGKGKEDKGDQVTIKTSIVSTTPLDIDEEITTNLPTTTPKTSRIPLTSTQRTSVSLNNTEETSAVDKDGIILSEEDDDSEDEEEDMFSTKPTTPSTTKTTPNITRMETNTNQSMPTYVYETTNTPPSVIATTISLITNDYNISEEEITTSTQASKELGIPSTPAAKDFSETLTTLIYETTTSIDTITTETTTTTTTLPTMIPKINESTGLPLIPTTPSSVLTSPVNILQGSLGPSSVTIESLNPNSSSDTGGTDTKVIIAIVFSVIGVIAILGLVAFFFLMRKRQKQMSYVQRCTPVSLDAYSLDNVSVLGSVRRKGANRASKRTYGNVAFDDPTLKHNVLNSNELGQFIEKRSTIFEEFRDVPQIIARPDEVPPGCEDKNRYANVIPLPETRVILQQQLNDEKTEYINANYVRGPRDAPNYYIACQAPLESTIADFWRMIWEQQSRVIIQATDLIENGIEKCAEYLPPSVTLDNHNTYGDYQVILKNREVKEKYAISTITLKHLNQEESREITHFWYKWPETGVPTEEAPIIAMLLEARSALKSYASEQTNGHTIEVNGNISMEKAKAPPQQGPLTVHCSPGTGRTGTIIACDMAIRSLETPKRTVDIPQLVYYVRRGRASAVQTKEQYEFIYKVANMYATKLTTLSNEN